VQVFGPVLYMDVPKTGSTFITEFLASQVRYAHERTRKHSRLQRIRQPGELVLLSSREPVGTWLSLYNYGCTGVGRVRRRLDRRGIGQQFYRGDPEDFDAWIAHLTSPDAVEDLGEDYASLARLGIGFATFRELVMSFDRPLRRFATWTSMDDARRDYAAANIVDVRLRHRSLEADLIAACHGPLSRHLRADADPVAFLSATPPTNVSARRVDVGDVLDRTRERIEQVEALWPWLDEGSPSRDTSGRSPS
jgi:hypothetical protein